MTTTDASDRRLDDPAPATAGPTRRPDADDLADYVPDSAGWLRGDDARDLVARFGAPVNRTRFADGPQQAARIAAELDGPVALKVVSPDMLHKARAGGLRLGVPAAEAAAATEALIASAERGGARVRGVTVEAMVPPGLELVVGAVADPRFGPMVMFGSGGVDVETLDDVAFAPVPLAPAAARRLVERTRAGRVLRFREPSALDAVVEALLAVGGAAGLMATGKVAEIDVNPLVVTKTGAVAVDARVRLGTGAPDPDPDPEAAYAALRPAIYPESVAVIGASTDTRKLGYRAVHNLVHFGFPGPIYPVSRTGATICGQHGYDSIRQLPAGVDRAVVAVPAGAVPAVLEELASAGVRSAHVYTADVDIDPAPLRTAGLRVLGPNSIGHYTPHRRVTMIAPDASNPEPGDVAVISQSGTYAGDVLRRGTELGIRFSFVSSVGNCVDVRPSELLAFAVADPATRVVGLYVEDDADAGALLRLAAGTDKPVVLFKGGRTRSGTAAAASHTGALAGDPRALRDLATASGVVIVEDLDTFCDTLQVLQAVPAPAGDGLGLVGSGGGVAVVGCDEAEEVGLRVPALGQTAAAQLERFAAPGTNLANPVDIPIWSLYGPDGMYTGALVGAVTGDPAVSAAVAYLDLGTVYDLLPCAEAAALIERMVEDLLAADRHGKPLLLVLRSSGAADQEDLVRRLRPVAAADRVPVLPSVRRAIGVLGRVRALAARPPAGS